MRKGFNQITQTKLSLTSCGFIVKKGAAKFEKTNATCTSECYLKKESTIGVASPKPGVGSSWKSSTLSVLNERIIRKIAEYPSYISPFFDIFSYN